MLHLDSFYTIGKTHQVCEDYVIHGEDPVPYVILGDGCSSSPDTDVGARLLVRNALDELIKIKKEDKSCDYDSFGKDVIFKTSVSLTNLRLSANSLDSTLVFAIEEKGSIKVFIYGDGVVIEKYRGSNIWTPHMGFMQVYFKQEMPYYLSYLLNEDRNNCYKKVITTNTGSEFNKYFWNPGGFASDFYKYNHPMVFNYPRNEIQFIIISSDGLDSFYHQDTGEKIPLEDVVTNFWDFKSFKGEFLKRRVKRILKDYAKQGIFYYDDLSLGIIYNDGEE